MASRSFQSKTVTSYVTGVGESQNSLRESENQDQNEFDDDDRNVLVQSDHLQMHSKYKAYSK